MDVLDVWMDCYLRSALLQAKKQEGMSKLISWAIVKQRVIPHVVSLVVCALLPPGAAMI